MQEISVYLFSHYEKSTICIIKAIVLNADKKKSSLFQKLVPYKWKLQNTNWILLLRKVLFFNELFVFHTSFTDWG